MSDTISVAGVDIEIGDNWVAVQIVARDSYDSRSLSPDEARTLAEALLKAADESERP